MWEQMAVPKKIAALVCGYCLLATRVEELLSTRGFLELRLITDFPIATKMTNTSTKTDVDTITVIGVPSRKPPAVSK